MITGETVPTTEISFRHLRMVQSARARVAEPVELDETEREVLYDYFTKTFIPRIEAQILRAEATGQRYHEGADLICMIDAKEPDYHHDTRFKISLSVFATPIAGEDSDKQAILAQVVIGNNQFQVGINKQADGEWSFENLDGQESDNRVIIADQHDLTTEIPATKTYPVGNPATWLRIIQQRNLLELLEDTTN